MTPVEDRCKNTTLYNSHCWEYDEKLKQPKCVFCGVTAQEVTEEQP